MRVVAEVVRHPSIALISVGNPSRAGRVKEQEVKKGVFELLAVIIFGSFCCSQILPFGLQGLLCV